MIVCLWKNLWRNVFLFRDCKKTTNVLNVKDDKKNISYKLNRLQVMITEKLMDKKEKLMMMGMMGIRKNQ